MTKDEALTLALEALEYASTGNRRPEIIGPAITAIKEALAQPERDPWREAAAQPERDPWREAAAQPEQKPVAWEQFHEYLVERNFCPRCGKRLGLDSIHTCTPPQIAAGPKAFYGFPKGSVSTPDAGGKCVTAGETAPIDPNQWAFDRGLESS